MRSMSWTCSTYARDSAPIRRRSAADATSGSSWARRVSLVVADDRDARSELTLRPLDGLVVEERHDGLPERHALDREEPVPAGVQLVDDDVCLPVALERLVVVEALHEDEVGVEPLARREHMLRALPPTGGRRVQDHRPRAVRGRRRLDRSSRRSRAGSSRPRVPSGSRRRSRRPPRRPSSRTRARRQSSRGCPSRGSASPTSCGARGGSGTGPTAARASARSRSGRRRCAAGAVRARATAVACLRANPPRRSSDQSASEWSS